jgi:hypothetical protein
MLGIFALGTLIGLSIGFFLGLIFDQSVGQEDNDE